MTVAFVIAFGVMLSCACYLLMARSFLCIILGLILLGNATNLAILLMGRIGSFIPPIITDGASALTPDAANPLPQALILTAIVISFALTTFALVLFQVSTRVEKAVAEEPA
jgi:multicomponent Na+:H+ antiporter subunit C